MHLHTKNWVDLQLLHCASSFSFSSATSAHPLALADALATYRESTRNRGKRLCNRSAEKICHCKLRALFRTESSKYGGRDVKAEVRQRT